MDTFMSVDFFAYLLLAVKGLLFFVACIFVISGFDDLVVDVAYAVRTIYRALFVWKKHGRMTEQQLLGTREQPIAVMIPAWDESAIIYHMIDNTISTLNYSNYIIFVGTYPNDAATCQEVQRLQKKHDNIHCVVCRDPGPTSKADCLNWIYKGILDYEQAHNVQFPIFVLEDAEDIIHPLTLRLFNYLIPRKDMVQLPVVPFEPDHWYHFTRGHYLDEFAENHHKNMVIREVFGRGIPCAGVGCGFSRAAFDALASDNDQQLVFKLGSLTEDYEIGMRLTSRGISKAIFVKLPIKRIVTGRSFFSKEPRQVEKDELVAIRNVFPLKFWNSVRQKSRWIAGIALQGWENLGWRGDLLTKYVLSKDRKSLLTGQVNMLGYVVVMAVLGYQLAIWLFPDAYHYPPLVEKGTVLYGLLTVTAVFLVYRILIRMYCVFRFYNLKYALLSIPNFIWANLINFFATNRALHIFFRSRLSGQSVKWDHTTHSPPTEQELAAYRMRIGDMLVDKRIISPDQLEAALAEQQRTGRLLGDILLHRGVVSENELLQTVGMQLRISTREIDPYAVPLDVIRLVPRELAVKHSLFPVERKDGKLIVAVSALPKRHVLSSVEDAIGLPVELCLTTRSSLSFSIQRGYERLNEQAGTDKERLGQLLLDQDLLKGEQLAEALRLQRQSYARLGDILLDEELISREMLERAFQEYAAQPGEFAGSFLVSKGYITQEKLDLALKLQKDRFQSLGQILVKTGAVTAENLSQALFEINDK